MVEIPHELPEPVSFANHCRKYPNGTWDTMPPVPVKQELREQLNKEQGGLCAYCEAKLKMDEGHIDHIKSKTHNPKLVFDYTNMAHSCNATMHCGHFKGHKSIPIEPRAGANRYFMLSEITGHLSPDGQLSPKEKAKTESTLHNLGLNNNAGLCWQRKKYAISVRKLIANNNTAEALHFLETAPFRWTLRRLV